VGLSDHNFLVGVKFWGPQTHLCICPESAGHLVVGWCCQVEKLPMDVGLELR
jgi:hypothetical protein